MAEVNDVTLAKLVETLAALNANAQSAQQTSQQLNQMISDMAAKLSQQTSTQNVAGQVLQEETGMGERAQLENADRSDLGYANKKRTYDAYQADDLHQLRNNQTLFQEAASQLQKELSHVNEITTQHLQNAVNTAKQIDSVVVTHFSDNNKEKLEHSDIASDHMWNLEPSEGASEATVLRSVTIDDASLKAIGALVAAALADALRPKT